MNQTFLRRVIGATVLFVALLVVSALLPDPQRGVPDAPGVKTVRIDLRAPDDKPSRTRAVSDSAPPQITSAEPEGQASSTPGEAGESAGQAAVARPSKPAVPEQESEPEPEPEGGQWWVQVASFSDPDNAARLRKRLAGKGLPSSVNSTQISGRTLHRVMVGGFATEQTADKARRLAVQIGFGDSRVRQIDP